MDDQAYWIGLNLSLSPAQLMSLLSRFPSARAIWEAPLGALRLVPGFAGQAQAFVQRRAQAPLREELREVERRGLTVLTLADAGYPAPLRELEQPPPVLYVRGTLLERDRLALAVVGTRRASSYGRRVAQSLTRALVQKGFTIVSGLALGVDTAAHQAALGAQGRTLAVLGSGFGALYPAENRPLAKRIVASGAVLSEFPIHTAPARWTFPRRNRVISGLSRGVLVVEAPRRSGALITAKLALAQGREVFAVPGSIHHPNAAGCHALIQDGAKLVHSVEDVLEEFPELQPVFQAAKVPRRDRPDLSPPQRRVFEALTFEPLHLNAIVERAGRSVAEVSATLIQLEMLGLASEVEGKHYVRCP